MTSKGRFWQVLQERGFPAHRQVLYLKDTVSTNDDALRLAREGALSGSIVVAESQSKGRGRLGRRWLSVPGAALTFSYLLRPSLDAESIPQLTLVAGLAVANAITRQTGLPVMIKWPNDVTMAGRKVAGLLCEFFELNGNTDSGQVVVIGVGINVSTDPTTFPAELRKKAGSLVQAGGGKISRASLLMEIIGELEKQLGRFFEQGFQPILQDWKKKDATLGKRLAWVGLNGRTVEGVSLGPNEKGVLRIVDDHGTAHEVLSGDLSMAE
jgi:BirA family biotin operon repressor/biotin-[acetyl-CoA-carboxylase] ligase